MSQHPSVGPNTLGCIAVYVVVRLKMRNNLVNTRPVVIGELVTAVIALDRLALGVVKVLRCPEWASVIPVEIAESLFFCPCNALMCEALHKRQMDA